MERNFTFFAVAPKGVEPLTLTELEILGIQGLKLSGTGVFFRGDLETGYRACLWLRTANRVLLRLAQFRAETPEALYEGVRQVRWIDHMDPEGSLAVDFHASHSRIHHTRFGAQKTKDAVVDQFREEYGKRPSVDLARPQVRINIYLQKDEATVSLDLSGESLHRRGYRGEGGPAPLKENLAAAILLRAGWPDIAGRGGGLMDPMTGSGTLPIEAAWMAGDVAPGLLREDPGFLRWKGHRPGRWEALLEEARQRRSAGIEKLPPMVGYDRDPIAIRSAAVHVERAGLRGAVHVEKRDMTDLVPHPAMKGRPGLVVLNPPYGERLGDVAELRSLYATIGNRLRTHFCGWRVSLFTGNPELGKEMGLRAEKKYILYNGPLLCHLLNFQIDPERFTHRQAFLPRPTRAEPAALLDSGAEMFANRLRKNLKRLKRAFRNKPVSCFRVYDRDLPEYAVAVDIYGKWVHVQEYQAPRRVATEKAEARLKQALAVIRGVLDVADGDLFLKVRQRQRGNRQYAKQDHRGVFHEVEENDGRFLVNLTNYIDTGLFLDQRMVRGRIHDLSGGKRFLNLFCYTGTATVAAAKGGARSTMSVDVSSAYLEWARRNFALNGLGLDRHALLQADVLRWLEDAEGAYDLIFMGTPTFSNSKGRASVLDVQRDHAALIHSAARVLKPGGRILFYCNYQKFEMDVEASSEFWLKDLSASTLPVDFERRSRMHHFWEVMRTRG